MNKYIVVTKEEFTRGTQLAPKVWIDSHGEQDYEDWLDVEGEIFLGVFEATNEEVAKEMASESLDLDIDLLKSISL